MVAAAQVGQQLAAMEYLAQQIQAAAVAVVQALVQQHKEPVAQVVQAL